MPHHPGNKDPTLVITCVDSADDASLVLFDLTYEFVRKLRAWQVTGRKAIEETGALEISFAIPDGERVVYDTASTPDTDSSIFYDKLPETFERSLYRETNPACVLFVVQEEKFGFYVVWEHKLIETFSREHEDFKTILPDPLLVLASADL